MSSHNLVATGDVLYNGIPRRQLDTKSLIAYVQQDDVLFEALTVKCKKLNIITFNRMPNVFCQSSSQRDAWRAG